MSSTTLQSIVQIVQTLGGAGSIVAILAVLALWKNGFFGKKADSGKVDTTLNLMRELKAHYNDETTELLREIRDSSNKILEGQNRIAQKLDEWERYGIKQKRN